MFGSTRVQDSVDALRTEIDSATGQETHLDYADLESLVDGRMDPIELEIAQSHLDGCPACRAELDEIRAFSKDLRQRDPVVNKSTYRSLLRWLASLAERGFERRLLQFAAAAACLVLTGWIATLPFRARISKLSSELAQARSESERAANNYAALKSHADELQARLDAEQPVGTGSKNPSIVDGRFRFAVDSEGKVQGLESIPPAYQRMVSSALLSGRVKFPKALEGIAGKAGTQLGGPDQNVSLALLSPVGTVVATDRPTFRWRALERAQSYRVEVFDPNLEQAAASESLAATHWTPPKVLERDRVYSWQVIAIVAGKEVKSPMPPAPEARFKILGKAEANALALARSRQGSHLLAGLLYAQAGLLNEAEQEFGKLARENPDSSTAKKLLSSVRALRNR